MPITHKIAAARRRGKRRCSPARNCRLRRRGEPPSGGGENAVPTAGGLPGSPGGDAVPTAEGKRGQDTVWFRPFYPVFTIYLTNCVLPISRDTNLTPKCSHSLQQFRCVLLLRTENVNVCVVCCRNIRMAKPLADYADRYARFQCPRSKGMSQLM